MKMKRPRPVYVYVEKKRLPRAKKPSSGEGAQRSRSNTPIGSSGQEKRKAAKTKPDEPTKKSSLRVFSSNAFGEMSATKRPTTSLHHHHPTSKNRRPSDWSSGRGYGESSDTQGRRSGKGSSREDSKREDHYRYSNDNNLLNNFEICSSSRSDTQRHRHHRKRKNYTITLCFDLPTNSSSHQLLPPPPPPPPPPPQPLPIRPVGSAAFSQCMSMSAPFAANQTNMSDCLSAYGGYIGNNMSSAFGQYNPNWNNGQTGYNNQQQQQPQQNTLGLYGSPMQYGTQAAPNFMNPTPQFSNIGSYGSNNFANNNMSNMNNYGYGLGLGFGGDNSSSLNNYGFGYDAAAYSAAAAAISAAASTPVASAPFTPAANTSNAFATSAALANDPATKPRENYFSKTSHGYNYYNSGYPPVSQPPIYSQFTSSNYFNNNYLGSLDNLKAQNTYANPYNSGNYGGQQYCNYPYNYNSSPSYGYNYRPSNHAFNHQVPVSASFSAANHITTPTPQYQYNEVYSVPYGTGANFVNELIHRSLQNNQQCFGYNSAAFPSPSSSRQSFNCLCLCFPENFRRPPNAFYHHFKRPPINTRYYHHRRTHHRSGLYDFSDSDYINNLIC